MASEATEKFCEFSRYLNHPVAFSKAQDTRTKRNVAVKLFELKGDKFEYRVQCAYRELLVLHTNNHPNVSISV